MSTNSNLIALGQLPPAGDLRCLVDLLRLVAGIQVVRVWSRSTVAARVPSGKKDASFVVCVIRIAKHLRALSRSSARPAEGARREQTRQ